MSQAVIRWSSTGRSDVGGKRKINEDSILLRTDAGIWLVADGMGGHEAGDIASGMVAAAVADVSAGGTLSQVVDRIEDALLKVNEKIRAHSVRVFGGRTMGSTVVMLVANAKLGVCLWAGDSRLYRQRAGKLEQISSDHSEVQELLDRGLLSPEEALHHPHSNVITRAVGGAPGLAVDVMLIEIMPDDIFVLCSDGLYNELSSEEINRVLGPDIERSADRLLAMTLERGARDNVSLLVIRAVAA